MSDMVLASKGYVDCLPRTYWEATVYKKTMSSPSPPAPYIASLEFNLYCNSPIKGVIKLTDWIFPQIATTEDDVYLYFVNVNNQPAKGDIVNPQYITKNSFKKGIHKNVAMPFDNAFPHHFEPKCGPDESHTGWISINDGRPMAIGQVKKEIIDNEEVYTYMGLVGGPAAGTILMPVINLTEPVEKTSTSQQRHENTIAL